MTTVATPIKHGRGGGGRGGGRAGGLFSLHYRTLPTHRFNKILLMRCGTVITSVISVCRINFTA